MTYKTKFIKFDQENKESYINEHFITEIQIYEAEHIPKIKYGVRCIKINGTYVDMNLKFTSKAKAKKYVQQLVDCEFCD